jgi:quercetin dioxygenase-like cupin family protein
MRTLKFVSPFLILIFFACSPKKQQRTSAAEQNAPIFPQGNKITNAYFTGTAYLQMLTNADSLNDISVGNVTFEPGARTNWHIHPAGQIILVTDGVGYYQEQGHPRKILHKGDQIKCPPNVAHWHGASKDCVFVQLAISSGAKGPAVWLGPVTEQQYNGE